MGSEQRQTVVITGCSGMLGTAITNRLIDRYDIAGLDIALPHAPPGDGFGFFRCDLTDERSVSDAIGTVASSTARPIASVIHLAAYYDFAGDPSPLYTQVTVRGTERLLLALRAQEVEQFVFSSTMLVHTPTERGSPIDEDRPMRAKWDYPQSKIDTERVIARERGDTPAVVLRIAGVYSDGCDSIPIANQIQRIYDRTLTSKVYPGDTSHGQAFVHLEDLVDAFDAAVERRADLTGETPIVIGEPETPGYGELQRRIAGLLHDEPDWQTREIPKPLAKAGAWVEGKIPGMEDPFIKPWMIDLADDHYELDISRARERLGWEPRHRLLDVLPEMISRLRRDPDAWFQRHNLKHAATALG